MAYRLGSAIAVGERAVDRIAVRHRAVTSRKGLIAPA
jgi:hypothetical protein